MRFRPAAILSATFLLSAPAWASAEPEESHACPPRITATQTVSSEIQEGWSDYGSKDEHPLAGVSFSFGPPDQKALLAPTSKGKKGRNTTWTWILPKSETDYWVVCEYAGTSAVLARPLGKEIGACTVEYERGFSTPVARSWRCHPRTVD